MRQFFANALDCFNDVGIGLFEHNHEHGDIRAGPAGLQRVLDPIDSAPNGTERDRAAGFLSDYERFIILRAGKLVAR